MVAQAAKIRDEPYWKGEMNSHYCFPRPEASPVHFGHLVGSITHAIPYHVVGPMACEYPYQYGQAQEDLSD